jgi:hypothetical protein
MKRISQQHLGRILLGLVALAVAVPTSAIAQGGMGGSDSDRLETYIERTGEIIQRAADFVADAPNPRSIRMLEQAEHAHHRSMEYMMGGQGRMAFLHSRKAREGAQQAARIAREMAGNVERLQRRMERYLELRDRVAERVAESGDDRAMRFVRESEQQARRARDLQQQGDVELALQVMKGAQDLLARAARIAFEGAGAGRLERELERTRAFVDRVAGEVGDDPAAAELLTSARMALTRAEEGIQAGQPMRALNSLQLARRLAGRAAAQDEQIDAGAVEYQIQRFDDRFDQTRERVGDSEEALRVMERARVHRDRAEALLGEGKLEAAMRQIKAGFDLLSAAHDVSG